MLLTLSPAQSHNCYSFCNCRISPEPLSLSLSLSRARALIVALNMQESRRVTQKRFNHVGARDSQRRVMQIKIARCLYFVWDESRVPIRIAAVARYYMRRGS